MQRYTLNKPLETVVRKNFPLQLSPTYSFTTTASLRTPCTELHTWTTKCGLLSTLLQKSRKLLLKLHTLAYWATLCLPWLSMLPYRNTNWLGNINKTKQTNKNRSDQITDLQSFWHVSLSIFRFSDDLHRLVNRYHFALNSLNEMKNNMLAEQICTVQNELYIGCKRLNWNSLGMLHTESYIFLLSNQVY